jgi:hypothetical protein
MSYKTEVLGHLFRSYEECFKNITKVVIGNKRIKS